MLFFLLAHRRSINFPLDHLTHNKVFVSLAHIVRWMPLLCRDMVEGAGKVHWEPTGHSGALG